MTYTPLDHPLMHRIRDQVLFAAGPIGSTILSLNLDSRAFVANPGTDAEEAHDGCPEWLNVSSPEVLESIFTSFYEVGCDAVDSASFGANDVVLTEFGLADRTRELNRIAAETIGRVRDRFSTPDWPRYSFGTMGPGTKLPSLGHVTWDELVPSYRKQALGLLEGGIDLLKVETCQDLLQLKAAVAGCVEAMTEYGRRIPVMASVTIESNGTMLLGTDIAAALTAIETIDAIDIIGINCATGPTEMLEHVRYLTENSRRPVFVGPNAGLPELVEGKACYPLTPEEFARYHRIFVDEFGVNIAAGCCGTTPAMLAAVIAAVGRRPPKQRPSAALFHRGEPSPAFEPSVSSLYNSTPIQQDASFLVVGERLNATGSRAFRDLLVADDLDGIVALARSQAAQGAHVLDVMVDFVGRDGVADMTRIAGALRTQSTLPLMFDSTEVPVVEAALKLYGGKAIVNSINLEDGENKITKLLPLIKRHGAAAVALTIDEDGQARTAGWKVAVARRICDIAVGRFAMEPTDLLIDCLTFPLSTGQEETRRDAIETLEAIRRVKEELPGVHTILGVSNCSFGLRPQARRVLNSVFLHEAVRHGLDAAIVNASQIVPLSRIPAEQVEVAHDLIYDKRRPDYDPLHKFISLLDEQTAQVARPEGEREALPVEDRLKARILEGDRRGLEGDLDEALGMHDPLTIINTYLLDAMRVVGDLFGSGQMQLPFVLQSAETMKAAVGYLEPHMERTEGQTKGTIVLATVRGDVHDIGKNLVDIILSNNGYTVHNLGIKQPIATIIGKAQEVGADAIGLSGLLVKSTLVMREDLEELNTLELSHYPVLLGGAALNRRYVEEDLRAVYHGSVYYCQDAFEGLRTMDSVMVGREAKREASPPSAAPSRSAPPVADDVDEYAQSTVRAAPHPPIPAPPFWGSRVVKGLPLPEVYPFINEVALFRGQWQYQRGASTNDEYEDLLDREVRPVLRSLKELAIAKALLEPQVVYGYFPALALGNDLVVWPTRERNRAAGEPVRFHFPRQPSGKRLCIADFFLPAEEANWDPSSATPPAVHDTVAFHVVTVGPKASEYAQELFNANKYREYLHFHGFSVETAEALAEYWHKRIRQELGIAAQDAQDVRELFQQHYQGSRYSFGYPACPDLEGQLGIAVLLEPSRIGCLLSETFQWHPEQTTSAIVVHHPAARYFTIR